eukprot:CAMPEP_0119356652 /NCGR_PEP_ID=MMETSP1334-20130426/5205_1 /TAXON_ID=127549 /ORGANISM="Calcidiscus leptoporus, Strain RCC1130" /LENGTH=211 /DNA_ID=CAMNT_0007370729 /DNA_START=85 /DNA_END=718 /DNA_ORIENTATION=+
MCGLNIKATDCIGLAFILSVTAREMSRRSPFLYDETKLTRLVVLLVAISHSERVPLCKAGDAESVVVQHDPEAVEHRLAELPLPLPGRPTYVVIEARLLQCALAREVAIGRLVQHRADQCGIHSVDLQPASNAAAARVPEPAPHGVAVLLAAAVTLAGLTHSPNLSISHRKPASGAGLLNTVSASSSRVAVLFLQVSAAASRLRIGSTVYS